MPKQLLDLTKEESEIVDKISKKWEMSKTDAIRKMIREYGKALGDNKDFDFEKETNIWG